MMKVRGEWGFSTAGRTLLCLTLTGVSGKSWLSCRHTRGRGVLSLRIRFPEPLHLIRFTQRDIKATHKVTFLLRGIDLLTLSIVPVRRIPTCCIRLVAPRVRLQSSKKVSQNGKENTYRLVCGNCSSRTKSFWNFFSYKSDVILH